MQKKSYVFDTSVFLTDAYAMNHYQDGNIIIPFKVLEEIDRHKKRQDGVGANARHIIRILDELREKGSLRDGIILENGCVIYVKNLDSFGAEIPSDLDISDADNEIIGIALREKVKNDNTILVSRDINMRVKCDSLGIKAEDYIAGQMVQAKENVYEGTLNEQVPDELVESFYSGQDIHLDKDIKLYPNQFITLESDCFAKKTALVRNISVEQPLRKVKEFKKGIWGVKARNREQRFVLDLMMDPDVPIVTLIGKAGCGKTLCALASGLEQVLEDQRYTRLVVTRPVEPLGRDIGFLPGTIEEKMRPWLSPIQDNLRYLMGDKHAFDMQLDRGVIEIEALTYIRGRSISDAFIIIDECQNTTVHEIKTILTRVGENTKIVLLGDIEQIDNIYIDETTNGLTYVIEKFKNHELAGHVTLRKGERSAVATLAAKVL
jgi:PhoH-like ATPase|tara:strand:- start:545 stop:1846 length:1302 start_codon:yes stop_codon:yes gene_type:complete